MAATANKQQLLAQAHTALKKKFPLGTDAATEPRPVLEEVLFAILRENTPTPEAEAAFRRLKESFFDWNEVRVSTISEVAEVIEGLPDSGAKAKRMIDFLQEHFERTYSFALEDLEKKGLKQAAKQLARYKDHGVSDFVVAWVTQRSLGGHAVPLDHATLRVLTRLGLFESEVDDLEAARATLEHFIPKTKGSEFTDLIVQLAVTICLPETPNCVSCPLKADCPTGQEAAAAKGKGKPKPR